MSTGLIPKMFFLAAAIGGRLRLGVASIGTVGHRPLDVSDRAGTRGQLLTMDSKVDREDKS